jgi:hypothetical protein
MRRLGSCDRGGRGLGDVLAEVFGVLAGSGTRAGVGGSARLVVGERVVLSGGAGERADAVQRADVVAVPGPAGREVQCPTAGVMGQATGDAEQAAAQGAGRADGAARKAEQLGPPEQVVREGGEHGPRAVGAVVAGGKVRQRLVDGAGIQPPSSRPVRPARSTPQSSRLSAPSTIA